MIREKDFLAIKELLITNASSQKAILEAENIAKKAFLDGHLYESLGFENRSVFNEYMARLYPNLSLKKPQEVRWKKFLFDSIGSIAPACYSCADTTICFKCDLLT